MCPCTYYIHAVDACPAYGRRGHSIKTQVVRVGYTCSQHRLTSQPTGVSDYAQDLSTRREESPRKNALEAHKDRLQGTDIKTAIGSPLRTKLLRKVKRVFDTDENFIPAGDFEQVLTCRAIKAELQSHGLEDLYSFVYKRAKKIFAILLVICKLDALHDFVKEDLGDELLPVADSALESLSDERLQAAFSNWDLDTRKQFSEVQWTVLVPVFSEAEHLKLDDNARLPFIETNTIASGSFGSVHRVEIHSDHDNFVKLESPSSKWVRLRSSK